MTALSDRGCDPAGIGRDPDAFFARWRPFISAAARRSLPFAAAGDCSVDREDVAQEGALLAWRRRDRYDPRRGAVHTWLGHMIRAAAANMRQTATAAKRRRPHDAEDEQNPDECPDRRSPEPENAADVWALVAGYVGSRAARALELRFADGCELKEVGAQIGADPTRACRIIEGALKELHRHRFELLRLLGRN
jgi:RNA polymerase sigma factor (sigma-70 family)